MGTFAETANVDYHLSFADQGEQIFHFPYIYIETAIYISMLFQTENGKRNPRRFSIIRLPFARRANRCLSFFHLFTKKQTEVIRLQTG
jgi:hypothetical protein